MKQAEPLGYRELAAYAEGEVTASKAEELKEVFSKSPESTRRLVRVKTVIAHLRDTSAVDGIDLLTGLKEQMSARRPSLPESERNWWRAPRTVVLVAAVAAAAVILPVVLERKDADTSSKKKDEYRVKSASTRRVARSRWIALNAFRLSGVTEPEPLRDILHIGDGLLFSYTNLGPEPFSYLMIFGVDGNRRVYWYYPAFLDARDNPKGIDIEKGASRAGLQEVIAHPYRVGPLTLFGLFSDKALSVFDIETAMQRGLADAAALEAAFDGVKVKALRVEVVP